MEALPRVSEKGISVLQRLPGRFQGMVKPREEHVLEFDTEVHETVL